MKYKEKQVLKRVALFLLVVLCLMVYGYPSLVGFLKKEEEKVIAEEQKVIHEEASGVQSASSASAPFPSMMCTEECRYNAKMCDPTLDPYNSKQSAFPAPSCFWIDDIYYGPYDLVTESVANNLKAAKYAETKAIAIAAANGVFERLPSKPQRKCVATPDTLKAMAWPDEFEIIVKTLVNARPKVYLEWGTGRSSHWYPALAQSSFVIDNFVPWCDQVREYPTFKCLEETKRLNFTCVTLMHPDGSVLPTGKHLGEMVWGTDPAVMDFAALQYINSIESYNFRPVSIDAAMIDGRLRTPCAIKLLHYLKPGGTLMIHDYWSRLDWSSAISSYNWNPKNKTAEFRSSYDVALKYYDVIGRSRTVAVLRPKPVSIRPVGWEKAYEDHLGLW